MTQDQYMTEVQKILAKHYKYATSAYLQASYDLGELRERDVAEVIGEDEKTTKVSTWKDAIGNVHQEAGWDFDKMSKNLLRAEQRKRAGLT